MKLLDDLIVSTARSILRGFLAIGTCLAYVQMLGLAVVLAIFGTVVATALLATLKVALFGA